MYNSLKKWINVDLQIKPFLEVDGAGVAVYGESVYTKCYPEEKIVTITDKNGVEVVSNTQLYLSGTTEINELDKVVLNGKDTQIKSISLFYRNGLVDLKVIYL